MNAWQYLTLLDIILDECAKSFYLSKRKLVVERVFIDSQTEIPYHPKPLKVATDWTINQKLIRVLAYLGHVS